jgi:hypothetical protein
MNTEIPPTVTPDALTQILHARADRALRAKINAAIPHDPTNHQHVPLSQDLMQDIRGTIADSKYWLPYLLQAVREGLFAAQYEAAREAEVRAFLAKVENTAAELDAIREEMQG